MDRYVIRERRADTEHPEGNQMIAFSATNRGNNITMSERIYCGKYTDKEENVNRQPFVTAPIQHVPVNVIPGPAVSGIDPTYLAEFNNNNTLYLSTGQSMQREPIRRNIERGQSYTESVHGTSIQREAIYRKPIYDEPQYRESAQSRPMLKEYTSYPNVALGSDYQNRNLVGAKRNEKKYYSPHTTSNVSKTTADCQTSVGIYKFEKQQRIQSNDTVTSNNQTDNDLPKIDVQNPVKTRAERLKELQKTGTRIFSGPVAKILKWHKSLKDMGIMVLYETVGKCVGVRAGPSCARNLVVRDENGPAINVVYYEIDFLLPELKPPCTVRVIGRIMPGTNRLQAFSVRAATGDDVAMSQRRVAVAAQHVANLCREYGVEVLVFK